MIASPARSSPLQHLVERPRVLLERDFFELLAPVVVAGRVGDRLREPGVLSDRRLDRLDGGGHVRRSVADRTIESPHDRA